MAETWYWIRHPGTYAGNECDFGQLLTLALATPKAEQLTRLGYLVESPKPKQKIQCGECGGEFLSEADRDAHGRKRHQLRFASSDPVSDDERAEREEAALLERAPLYLEKTEATRR